MPSPQPVSAPKKPVTIQQLGRIRSDNYAWLKDENWQQVMRDPSLLREDIRAYLVDENAHTRTELEEPTEALRQTLFEEMRGRIKEDDSSVPATDGPWAYGSKYRTGGEYPILYRLPRAEAFNKDAEQSILFDGDAEGKDAAYFDIGAIAHSPDHTKLAYAIDDQGSEYYTIRVRDIATGKTLDTTIERTTGSFVWTADSLGLYWVERNDNGRSCAVHLRWLGSTTDKEIYRETDEGFFVGVDESQSGDYVFITANDHTTSEWRFLPANTPEADPVLIMGRHSGHEYSVDHYDGQFVILTNWGDAVDFMIATAPIGPVTPGDWTELVSHTPGTLILGYEAIEDYLVRTERFEGLPRIVVRERQDGNEHTISFDDAAYSVGASAGYEFSTDIIRLYYASPSTPDQVFDYNLKTREKTLRKTREVPSGHVAEDYVVERILAPAHDGETVPVTILRKADTPLDGSAPLLLYGYGSYGITIPASFSTSRLSLVQRGFVYAIAHVRGSEAKGRAWYLNGKLDKKTNTFKDYISAAEALIDRGYSSKGNIVGLGGSAGGLLMGAVSNMGPDFFAGIIGAVPFIDVLNTMSDPSLPLTPPEWPEWGNPLEDADAYDLIESYSPYDQITDQAYPPMLITGGLSDPRVTYWEPAKWAAKLREVAPNGGPYYLRINMDAGHGGASGRFEALKETAIEYAFALKVVGLASFAD